MDFKLASIFMLLFFNVQDNTPHFGRQRYNVWNSSFLDPRTLLGLSYFQTLSVAVRKTQCPWSSYHEQWCVTLPLNYHKGTHLMYLLVFNFFILDVTFFERSVGNLVHKLPLAQICLQPNYRTVHSNSGPSIFRSSILHAIL